MLACGRLRELGFQSVVGMRGFSEALVVGDGWGDEERHWMGHKRDW